MNGLSKHHNYSQNWLLDWARLDSFFAENGPLNFAFDNWLLDRLSKIVFDFEQRFSVARVILFVLLLKSEVKLDTTF